MVDAQDSEEESEFNLLNGYDIVHQGNFDNDKVDI